MTSEQKPRFFYITRDEGSTDRDKLTHIVLFEYHADKDPMKVVDAEVLEQAQAEISILKDRYAELDGYYEATKEEVDELEAAIHQAIVLISGPVDTGRVSDAELLLCNLVFKEKKDESR